MFYCIDNILHSWETTILTSRRNRCLPKSCIAGYAYKSCPGGEMQTESLVAVRNLGLCLSIEELCVYAAFTLAYLETPAFHAAATIKLATWSQGVMSATLLWSATTTRKTPFAAPAMKAKPPVCTLSIQPGRGSFRVPKTEIRFAQNKPQRNVSLFSVYVTRWSLINLLLMQIYCFKCSKISFQYLCSQSHERAEKYLSVQI
jgi:hypothetical protein